MMASVGVLAPASILVRGVVSLADVAAGIFMKSGNAVLGSIFVL